MRDQNTINGKRRLIEVLSEMGISKKVLSEAVDEYYEVQFGRWLVGHGVITEEQLQLALAQQSSEIGDFKDAQTHLDHLSKCSYKKFSTVLESASRTFDGLSSLITSAVENHTK